MSVDDPAFWLPLVSIAFLFGILVVGIVLDGFDLGVGILLPIAPESERAGLLALLSSWREVNEFWLVVGIGLFAAAFPFAWGVVLGQLYFPLTLMLIGMVLRSVCFEFRLRARTELKPLWIRGFGIGALLMTFGQGMALGRLSTGSQDLMGYYGFSLFVGLCMVAAYILLGATWLTMRLEGELQQRAVHWARQAIRWTAAGMVAIAVVLGLANARIFYKWSSFTYLPVTAIVWIVMLLGFVSAEMVLVRLHRHPKRLRWVPFAICVGLFVLMLGGLAYSLFPYLLIGEMTFWDGAASLDALRLILVVAPITILFVLLFNMCAYRYVYGKLPQPVQPVQAVQPAQTVQLSKRGRKTPK